MHWKMLSSRFLPDVSPSRFLPESLGLLFGGARSPLAPDQANTFRPRRAHRVGTRRYELHRQAQATLGAGDLHEAVTLPDGVDVNEWLAVHTIDFYNSTNLIYGTISEFCTDDRCPCMSAGPKYEYAWADDRIRKPMSVSAPRYVDLLMRWVQRQLDDDAIFPTSAGTPFPTDFTQRVQQIFKRLFRVFAHIYYSHFDRIAALGVEPHLNTSFKHFMYFVYEFGLIPNRQELEPLQELIDKLFARDDMLFARFGNPISHRSTRSESSLMMNDQAALVAGGEKAMVTPRMSIAQAHAMGAA